MSHQATNWAFSQRGLKPSAKLVLLSLADCHNPAHGCFPTQAYLAEVCELNRDTVNVQLALLEERGLIRRIRSIDPRTKRQRPTRYKLAFEDDFDAPVGSGSAPARAKKAGKAKEESGSKSGARRASQAAKAVSEIPAEPCRKNPKSRVGNSDTNLVKEPVMEPCVGDASAADIRKHFERFWKAHPRPRDRARAQKLFTEAVTLGIAPDRLVQAATRYRAENVGNKPMYLAYADNWLENARWEDFPDIANGEQQSASLQAVADFWADTIRKGKHVPASAVSPDVAKILVQSGAVSETDLRRLGVQLR